MSSENWGPFPLELEDIGPVCWCGGCAEDPCDLRDHEAKAYSYAAAAAFGLMGMAVAIKKRQGYQEWMRITTHPARPISFDDEQDPFCNCGDYNFCIPETHVCPVHDRAADDRGPAK